MFSTTFPCCSGKISFPGRKGSLLFLVSLLLSIFLCPSLPAQGAGVRIPGPRKEKGDEKKGKKKDSPLQAGELLLFQEIPLVVTAGRRPTAKTLSPAPVSLFTSKEIDRTGLTSLPEILSFLPGMDVSRVDRLRYATGVRGLHSFFADRTLTLIDGRNATHPAFGGTIFPFLPLMVEDIDRIEVVRGPIGAAWGANAFNGAINIITKKPGNAQGFTVTGRIDEFGDNRTFLRWGSRKGDLSWRLSSSYESIESSSDALTGENFDSNDSLKDFHFDGRGLWKAGDKDTLSFGASHGWNKTGDFEQFGYWPRKHGRVEITRTFAKHTHRFDPGTTAYLQAFCNREKDYFPSEGRLLTAEYDLETQVEGEWIEGHKFSLGGNFRFISIDPGKGAPQELRFPDHQVYEHWAGLFFSDTWEFARRTTLDLQARGDHYSETGFDWSGRVSLLRDLGGDERQVARFSLAHSFRAPLFLFRRMSFSRLPLGGGIYGLNFLPSPGLDNEEIYSIEGGYSGKLAKGLSLNINTYYQFLDDLIGKKKIGPTEIRLANAGRARAYGGEIEADGRIGPVQARAWYGYNGFHSPQKERRFRSFRPARHQAGAELLADLPAGFRAACLYKYSTAIHTPATKSIPVTNRVDLTLGKVFAGGNATFQVGAEDLFRRTDKAVHGIGSFTGHETPGRTFFARLILTF